MSIQLVKYDPSGKKIWSHTYNCNKIDTIFIKKLNKYGKEINNFSCKKNLYSRQIKFAINRKHPDTKYICYLKQNSYDLNTIIISRINDSWKIASTFELSCNSHNYNPEINLKCDGYIYLSYIVDNHGYMLTATKLNLSGKTIWTYSKNMSDSDKSLFKSMDTDEKHNIYIAHQQNDSISIIKINKMGKEKWVHNNICDYTHKPKIKSIGDHIYIACTTDKNTGKIYNKTGLVDVVLIKLNKRGEIIYTYQDRSFNTIDINDDPDIAIDETENVYLTYVHRIDNVNSTVIAKFNIASKNCGSLLGRETYLCEQYNKNIHLSHSILKNNILNYIDFYKNQHLVMKKMMHILEQIICLSKYFDENISDIHQHTVCYNNLYNSIPHPNKFFELCSFVDNIGRPLSCASGWCGIQNKPINCSFEIKVNCSKEKFQINTHSDIKSIVKHINSKYESLICIGGLEIGIKINCVSNIKTNILEIVINDCPNITYLFTVNGNEPKSYINLMEQLKCKMGDYIKLIYYDKKNNIIKIVFKKPYMISYRQKYKCPVNQFVVSTYINDIPINYGTTSTKKYRYVYPYIVFYSADCKNIHIKYSNCGMGDMYYGMDVIRGNMLYYGNNLTGNIYKTITYKIIRLDSMKYIDDYKINTFDKSTFMSYGDLLIEMISNYQSNRTDIKKINILKSIHQIKKCVNESYENLESFYETLQKISGDTITRVYKY